MDLVLNNVQSLICHKTQLTNQPTNNKKKTIPNINNKKFFRSNK